MGNTKKANYGDLIFKDEKAKKAADKQEAVEDAKLNVMAGLGAARKVERVAQRNFDKALSAVPFLADKVIEAKRALADAKEDVKDLEELQEFVG